MVVSPGTLSGCITTHYSPGGEHAEIGSYRQTAAGRGH